MVSVASPCAAVVIGVGSLAPLRNATKRSGGGGTEVSPTSSLQLPTVQTAAAVSVSPPSTKRPRIAASSVVSVNGTSGNTAGPGGRRGAAAEARWDNSIMNSYM